MRVLILGGNGMLGHKVFQVLSGNFDCHASFTSLNGYISAFPVYERQPLNHIHLGHHAEDTETTRTLLTEVRPDVVINCIGIIKQIREASDSALTISLNSLFPHRLARLCSDASAKLVHISTDCVFSGKAGMYRETDPTDAEDLYGKSKALGEVVYDGHLTVRTSIIGREWVRSTALLEWLLSMNGGRVKGYRNAVYSGLTTEALGNVLLELLSDHMDVSGLMHVSSKPLSKYQLLDKIRSAFKLSIDLEPYDDPPCDRSLDSSRFLSSTGISVPSWDEMTESLAADSTPYNEWRNRNASLGG